MTETPTPEHLERLLKSTYAIAEENNRLLREMRRWGRIAFWTKVAVWLLVLVLPFYLYSAFLAPWLSGAHLMGLPTFEEMRHAWEIYRGG